MKMALSKVISLSLKLIKECLLPLLLCFANTLHAQERKPSFPYISGDTFRSFCDYIVDETQNTLIPSQVQWGSTIFLKTDYLDYFFNDLHPLIANPYILVTHNSDFPCPGNYAHYLDDPKLLAWFGQNNGGAPHTKLHPIPIGLANRYWPHGSIEAMQAMSVYGKTASRPTLLYMNIAVSTYPTERTRVYNLFKDKPYCTKSEPKDFPSYLRDIAHSKFVLSPRGNGIDCHRTWEALLLGAIPIVKTSSLDPLFKDLPVLIITTWEELSEDFLRKKWEEMRTQEYNTDKLYAAYWRMLVAAYKDR